MQAALRGEHGVEALDVARGFLDISGALTAVQTDLASTRQAMSVRDDMLAAQQAAAAKASDDLAALKTQLQVLIGGTSAQQS